MIIALLALYQNLLGDGLILKCCKILICSKFWFEMLKDHDLYRSSSFFAHFRCVAALLKGNVFKWTRRTHPCYYFQSGKFRWPVSRRTFSKFSLLTVGTWIFNYNCVFFIYRRITDMNGPKFRFPNLTSKLFKKLYVWCFWLCVFIYLMLSFLS